MPQRFPFLLSLTFAVLTALASVSPARAETPSVPKADPAPTPSSEDWVYLDNGQIRLGVLRSSGAGIAFFARVGAKRNLLNHYDRGRLIQQSYYGDEDGSMWNKRPWRYNPVQGGEWQGQGGRVLELKSDKTSLYAKTQPRHWASGALLTECVMEEWITLEDKLAHLRFQITYNGTKTHAPRHQEMPAVFVDQLFSTMVTYQGDDPWGGGKLTRRQPGLKNEYVRLPEHWAAYVAGGNEGLGVYVPLANEATCYAFRGGNDSNCSYFAPIGTFALKPGLVFTYDAYLATGEPEDMRALFQKLHEKEEAKDPRQPISNILLR